MTIPLDIKSGSPALFKMVLASDKLSRDPTSYLFSVSLLQLTTTKTQPMRRLLKFSILKEEAAESSVLRKYAHSRMEFPPGFACRHAKLEMKQILWQKVIGMSTSFLSKKPNMPPYV